MKKKSLIIIVVLLLIGICGTIVFLLNRQNRNIPYEPDTPAPASHDGIFVCEHGEMVFNGDGHSITIKFDEELSSLIGMPSKEINGEYAFMSGFLPPNGNTNVRYDVAHELWIMSNDTGDNYHIELGIASSDGKSATSGTDTVTPNRIPLLFTVDNKNVSYIFEKK